MTELTGPCGVAIAVVVWAWDCVISPRSALMTTPKVTDAITIASVEINLLVDWLITLLLLLGSVPRWCFIG